MEGQETARRDSKVDKAARLLKSRRADLSPTKYSTRRPSSASISQSGVSTLKAATEPQFENTFKMEPTEKFPERSIRNILKEVLSETLAEVNYEPNTCRQLTKTISDDLKSKVRDMNIQRYKIICLVHIGQLAHQAMRIGSRCLWDANFDSYTSYEFKNGSLFAVGTVYGVYFE